MKAEDLAFNFSQVLHELPSSEAVQGAVRSARKPLRRFDNQATLVFDGNVEIEVDLWLAPSVGYPDDLADLLSGDTSAKVMIIDRDDSVRTPAIFFAAPADLVLPVDKATVGVAALVQRPGGRSRQLIARGPYSWPADQTDALRAIEEIIQAFAEQWRPSMRLWKHPFTLDPIQQPPDEEVPKLE